MSIENRQPATTRGALRTNARDIAVDLTTRLRRMHSRWSDSIRPMLCNREQSPYLLPINSPGS